MNRKQGRMSAIPLCASVAVILIVALSFLCLGMGDMPESDKKIPKPKRNFKASITDVQMAESQAEFMACGGKAKLQGFNGKTEVLVPFEKIRHVTFADHDNRYQKATVTFWNGKPYKLNVKRHLVCSGITELGEMRVKVKYIRKVDFEKGEFSDIEETTTP
jgi:hypothetical protein